jgi:hypothetical protein
MEVNQQDFTSSNCVTRPVISDRISTTRGEDLNNQSFLRLKAKFDEKNLIDMDTERLANGLSLVQSQLTDFLSKVRQFDIELATTKSELEEKKSLITDMTEVILRLANDDSQLRQKIEDRDRIIESSAIEKNLVVMENERLANELSLLQSQLTDSSSKLREYQNVHDELATTKSELEKQKSVNTDITEINLRLTNENSWLRQKIKDMESYIASAPHQTYVQEDLGVPHQFTPINRTLFEPTKCHGNQLHHNSNTEEVGLRYLSDDKNPNELYPLSLLQELRSNQNSPEKFDLLEKNDNQLKPEDPPNPEKSDFKEKKDHQTHVKPKDPHELAQNEEKCDLLEKKFNNKLLELNNQMLELNNKINFLLKPKDPHALPQNPTEKSDLFGEKDNESQTKPEDPQVLGNPKVEQVPETDKKQSIGKNIKKSLLSVKELFQPRKQTEVENNPAEKNEPDVEKCVINGKTFPISNSAGYPLTRAAVNYNVWKSIGKPRIAKTTWTAKDIQGKSLPILGQIKVEIAIKEKKSMIPILVINNPSKKNVKKAIYIF